MSDLRLEKREGIAVLTLDAQHSKLNLLTPSLLLEMRRILEDLHPSRGIKALMIQSAKPRSFIAGADIKEIESIESAEEGKAKSRAGQSVLNLLEDLPFPSLALINGAALGGGLELALAASYCFACFGSEVLLGLPEVRLGIIPGFGGTFRLPRRVGLQKGIELISQGRILDPVRAHAIGLVDGVFPEKILFQEVQSFLEANDFQKGRNPKPKRSAQEIVVEKTRIGRWLLHRGARASACRITRGLYPAVEMSIDVTVKNFEQDRDTALAHEAEAFGTLVARATHKPLIHVFQLTERYKKKEWSERPPKPIDRCAVIGAGIMGGAIAQTLSSEGIPVRMKDIDHSKLLMGLRSAESLYREAVRKQRLSEAVAKTRMNFIHPTLDYVGFKHCGLVIEAVIEDLELKKKVFQEVERVTGPEAILASNTSSLAVSQMGAVLKDPGRVAGLHFFNPVHRMPLVEVVRAKQTRDDITSTLVAFCHRIKKTPLVVQDRPGFLVNRILMPFLNEAGFLFEEGEDPELIDRILMDFGMPMGAFWLLDEIGLDVAAKVAHVLKTAFGKRMESCSSLDKMVEKKWLGKKTGRGFYIHTEKGRKLNPNLAPASAASHHTPEEILERCLSLMVNEAAHCLEERVVNDVRDVDVALILGIGFPPVRGGLLRWADGIGIPKIIDCLEAAYQKTGSERFIPAEFLKELKEKNRLFYMS